VLDYCVVSLMTRLWSERAGDAKGGWLDVFIIVGRVGGPAIPGFSGFSLSSGCGRYLISMMHGGVPMQRKLFT
jgi:hypothetical protein